MGNDGGRIKIGMFWWMIVRRRSVADRERKGENRRKKGEGCKGSRYERCE